MILRYEQQRESRNPRLMVVWDEGHAPEDITAIVRVGEKLIFYTARNTYVKDEYAE